MSTATRIPPELEDAIFNVLENLWKDERHNYEETKDGGESGADHIFHSLELLRKFAGIDRE